MADPSFEQPVVGMKTVWDFPWNDGQWRGREWFVVKDARVELSSDGALLPRVRMGVEAREQVADARRQLVDAPVTSKGHPLVRYAEIFTHFFDLIAERKSVVHQLREVSRAAVVAKFLVDNGVHLDDFWMRAEEASVCRMDLPFNKQERYTYEVVVCHGALQGHRAEPVRTCVSLCGGVDLNIDAFDLRLPAQRGAGPAAPDYAAIFAEVGYT
ncbi:unnamed protein product [Prorocentrum cordatum]|uniref:Uncharacterized protein n=1 Tax=Prorocentrum cordatum TaxID=2364126 RepID=A0ABN9VWM6_9DINO|nr:unnamed protein product [Polarella glacialis]